MNSANVPVFHRRLDFQVLGLDQNHLRVLATLEDMMHHFILTVDVRVPEMLIASATLEIPRYPNRRCRLIRPAVDQLVGLKIERGFTDRVKSFLLGPQGCTNLFNLVVNACPLALNTAGALPYFFSGANFTDSREKMKAVMKDQCIAWSEGK
jgi:hypothetical protein